MMFENSNLMSYGIQKQSLFLPSVAPDLGSLHHGQVIRFLFLSLSPVSEEPATGIPGRQPKSPRSPHGACRPQRSQTTIPAF